MGKVLKQATKDPRATKLVRLWDMGTDGIILSAAEAEKLSNKTT